MFTHEFDPKATKYIVKGHTYDNIFWAYRFTDKVLSEFEGSEEEFADNVVYGWFDHAVSDYRRKRNEQTD